jgi:hypothetical protein
VVVDVSVLVPSSGDAVVVEECSLVVVVFVSAPPPDGEGFTIVVLLPPPGEAAGDAPGAAFSIRCSHDARRAALAMMQMYFVIVW